MHRNPMLIMPDDLTLLAAVLKTFPAGERLTAGRAFLAVADYGFHVKQDEGGRTNPDFPYALSAILNRHIDRQKLPREISDRGMSAHNNPEWLSCMALASLAASQHILMPDARFEEILGIEDAAEPSPELMAIRDKMQAFMARTPREEPTGIEP